MALDGVEHQLGEIGTGVADHLDRIARTGKFDLGGFNVFGHADFQADRCRQGVKGPQMRAFAG